MTERERLRRRHWIQRWAEQRRRERAEVELPVVELAADEAIIEPEPDDG